MERFGCASAALRRSVTSFRLLYRTSASPSSRWSLAISGWPFLNFRRMLLPSPAAALSQAPVAERPVVLPPVSGNTREASQQSERLGDHLGKSDAYLMDQLAASREAIAHSRRLLDDLKARNKGASVDRPLGAARATRFNFCFRIAGGTDLFPSSCFPCWNNAGSFDDATIRSFVLLVTIPWSVHYFRNPWAALRMDSAAHLRHQDPQTDRSSVNPQGCSFEVMSPPCPC